MNIELSLKNILIVVGVVSAFSGNIFVLGKVFSDFEILKTEIQIFKRSKCFGTSTRNLRKPI